MKIPLYNTAHQLAESGSSYSPFRDMASKCLVSPRRIAQAFSRAYLRVSERMEKVP